MICPHKLVEREDIVMKKRLFAALLLTVMSLCACTSSDDTINGSKLADYPTNEEYSVPEGTLRLTSIKMGEADSFIIQTTNFTVVMDTGMNKKGKKLVKELKDHGVKKIDALVISHYDKDHVGGADKAIKYFDIGNVYSTYRSKTSDEMTEYYAALKAKGVDENVVSKEISFEADGVTYTIYPAQSRSYVDDISNNSSLAMRVVNGNKSILFTGDALEERIEELVNTPGLESDILKVPHHGREKEEEIFERFIDYINPSYAIIPTEGKSSEEHKIADYLKGKNIETFITSDGDRIFDITADDITTYEEE